MIEKGEFKKSIALMRTKCFRNFKFLTRNVGLEIYGVHGARVGIENSQIASSAEHIATGDNA